VLRNNPAKVTSARSYGEVGHPSITPEKLLRAVLLQFAAAAYNLVRLKNPIPQPAWGRLKGRYGDLSIC
jgi:hypothetical protein